MITYYTVRSGNVILVYARTRKAAEEYAATKRNVRVVEQIGSRMPWNIIDPETKENKA